MNKGVLFYCPPRMVLLIVTKMAFIQNETVEMYCATDIHVDNKPSDRIHSINSYGYWLLPQSFFLNCTF